MEDAIKSGLCAAFGAVFGKCAFGDVSQSFVTALQAKAPIDLPSQVSALATIYVFLLH